MCITPLTGLIDGVDVTCVTIDDLRSHSEAYARWSDPRDLAAATASYIGVMRLLTRGESQFERDRGLRETGRLIRALSKYYDVVGNAGALAAAECAARWVIAERSIADGGFGHTADALSRHLEDSLAIAGGLVALYRSTGRKEWLLRGGAALDFIDAAIRISHEAAGAEPPPRLSASTDELVSVANLLERYTGEVKYRRIAIQGMECHARDEAQRRAQLSADGQLWDAREPHGEFASRYGQVGVSRRGVARSAASFMA